MDFYEVVGQVVELLQRQGKVSYRALKRQFGMDDDFIVSGDPKMLSSGQVEIVG